MVKLLPQMAAAAAAACALSRPALALDNGFVTPALGWSSWYAAPWGSQVTDSFVRASAQALVSSGLAKKGYKYVNGEGPADRQIFGRGFARPALYLTPVTPL